MISTQDGSEAAEDQQLLDSGSPGIDYPIMQVVEPVPTTVAGAPHMSYGRYYDHASGFYYDYPMMLVGSTLATPDQMGAGMMAVPIQPVPLRPIEWVNPPFVPNGASPHPFFYGYQVAIDLCTSFFYN